MGKANRGASTTGNTIFGQKKFFSQIPTETMFSPCLKISDSVGGRDLNVVDYGGMVDQVLTRNMISMLNQSGMWFPRGVHVILLVMSAIERLSKEEISAIESLRQSDQNILGKYVICVFTHGDSFHRQMEQDRRSLTFGQYIESVGGPMQKLLQDCHNRYILFNNAEADPGKKRERVTDLIRLIDCLIKENGEEKLSLDPENVSDDDDC
ncbi:immune-associated nucleotide-binding protein 9-like [Haliotis rubra]|uniref:immune-associated nucleotide-binding protein 9-like n=1 Tax=Haliotis rubra TaxID=36100 RepID=UPI001EE566D2|nr:immune-associated nucleotide-binding protein 9-like [Haliotis rubra]